MSHSASAAARSSRGERTASRLRLAARQVFAEVGYAASRVEDIVTSAGVSHGTFYTYYDNRAGVLDALVTEAAGRLEAVASEPWIGVDARAAVQGVIDRFLTAWVEDGDIMRVWLEAAAHERHFGERLREVRRGYIGKVAGHLAPVLAGTPHEPMVAASALVAMVEGFASESFPGTGSVDASQASRTLADLWYGALVQLTVTAPLGAR